MRHINYLRHVIQAPTGPLEAVVMADPFIAPEHRELIEKAEAQLREYDAALLRKLRARLDAGGAMAHRSADVKQAQEEFASNPFRNTLMKLIVDMRMLFERPRFIIRKP